MKKDQNQKTSPTSPTSKRKPRLWLFMLKALAIFFSAPLVGKKGGTSHASLPKAKQLLALKKRKNKPQTKASQKATLTPIKQHHVNPSADHITSFIKPIEGARLSSNYGYRHHPVLKRAKFHKGIDLAAKKGTPILAPADGIVIVAQPAGGYGNYVRIRHPGKVETAYAHLSRYHAKLKVGLKIAKGDIIGYVGNTGRSTGPHLHFEVIKKGRHVNPRPYLV